MATRPASPPPNTSLRGPGCVQQQRVSRQALLRQTRKGSKWLRGALTESAHAASQTKDTYLAALFWRLTGRRGKKRAAVAVGHSILVAAYHILDRQQPYHDLGGDWFLERYSNQAHTRRLVRQLERLGHKLTIEPAEAA